MNLVYIGSRYILGYIASSLYVISLFPEICTVYKTKNAI